MANNQVAYSTSQPLHGEQTVFERDTRPCEQCKCYSVQVRQFKRTNHKLHLMLSIALAGLWLPVWFYLHHFAGKSKWTCQTCGRSAGESARRGRSLLVDL